VKGGDRLDSHASGNTDAQVNSTNESEIKGNAERLTAGSINKPKDYYDTNDQNNIEETKAENESLTYNFYQNLETIKEIFSYTINEDFFIREIYIESLSKDGVLLFLQGTIDTIILEKQIINPLINYKKNLSAGEDTLTELTKRIITDKSVKRVHDFNQVTTEIIQGSTVLLIRGFNEAISISSRGYKHRSIEKPVSENTIKGPKEAFIESDDVNRSLIRKYVQNENLITERLRVGKKNVSDVLLMYIKDVADPCLVDRVKQRIKEIKVDYIPEISLLEEHMEERPYSLVPTLLATERPDRTAFFLLEGHVALLMNGSPTAIIAPITFWSLFHNPEDQYQRWAYGNFIRIIRLACCFIALLAPGFFIAVTDYHIDMIPTDLVLAIASTRENLPFPALIEVVVMEFSFELLREAGVRIPTPIGPTIGIVGALILGQAAVEANVVSPILVIVVAVTGLASFAIPEVSLSYMIRIARFPFLLACSLMGFYGFAVAFTLMLAYLSTVQSFGVYFMSPYAPSFPSSKDMVFRPPAWKQWLRPMNQRPQKAVRQKKQKGS
jgi:spore germination protein KA